MSGHADACGQPSGHWSGRPLSEHRARPLVTAVRGNRPESPSGVDAWRSWAGRRVVLGWTPVWTGSGHSGCRPPEHAPGVSAAALVRGRLCTWPSVDAGGGHGRGCPAQSPQRTPPSGRPAASRQCGPQREPRPSGRTAMADTSLEGASGQSDHAGCFADGPAQRVSNRPLLSVGDRQGPMLRARGGHGRRARTHLAPDGDGHQPG